MQPTTFASAAWANKGKVTRRERFPAEMDAVIPWNTPPPATRSTTRCSGNQRIRFNPDLIKQCWQRDVFAVFNPQCNMAGQTFSGVLTGFRLGIPGRGKTGETRHKNRIL